MISQIVPICLFTLNVCFGWDDTSLEGKCPFGCCQRYRDYEIYDIEELLQKCLFNISFKESYVEKHILHSDISDFCEEVCYSLEGAKSSLSVSIENDVDDSDYNPFIYLEWASPYDVDFGLSKKAPPLKDNLFVQVHDDSDDENVIWEKEKDYSIALENYPFFPQFCSDFKEGLIKVTQETLDQLKNRIIENKEILKKCSQNEDYAFDFWLETFSPSIIDRFNWNELKESLLQDIKYDEICCSEIDENLQKKLLIFENTENEIYKIYEHIFNYCIEHHNFSGSFYNRGFYNYYLGKNFEALQDVKKYIESGEKLSADVYKLKGDLQTELGLYNEAINTLTKAIELDPENKDAYFVRAQCYFELNNFDVSLQDFLKSEYKSTPIDQNSTDLEFAMGFILGSGNGIKEGFVDLIFSVFSSMNGLSHGIWSLVSNPNECSQELVQASINVINALIENPIIDTLKAVIPELKEFEDKKNLSNFRKGEIIGTIIGKYGIECLAIGKSMRVLKSIKDFKKANTIYTLEKLSTKEASVVKEAAVKWEEKHLEAIKKFKNGEKILKNYKGYYSENEARKILHQAGFETFSRPKGIPDDFRITFSNKGGGMKYVHPERTDEYIRVMPGRPYSPNPWQQKPYVKHQIKGGKVLDKYGNIVAEEAQESHIPLDEFNYFAKEK